MRVNNLSEVALDSDWTRDLQSQVQRPITTIRHRVLTQIITVLTVRVGSSNIRFWELFLYKRTCIYSREV